MIMETRNKSKNTAVVLILIILFGVLLRFVFSVGIIGSGDFVHLIYSQKASVGNFSLTIDDPQTAARIGYVYPVALFYRIFGISEFSMYFYTLIMSAASIILIYFHINPRSLPSLPGTIARIATNFSGTRTS